uniref:DDE_3 domain-containing protein n=1 Tax=Heterorhabditis bacteriophora TaxID=37862 RepID=A0A1I7WD36_HETBA
MPEFTLVEALRPGWMTMIWPSRSPDLNPMENLWAILFETAKDLQSVIRKAWNEVDKSVIKNLVNSISERIFQVINRSGSCIDY